MAIKSGTTGNDTVRGSAAWDTLYALAGNDLLSGGSGRDILSGGDGNDVLEGGAGRDSLHGGTGADVFKYTRFDDAGGDKIIDFSAGDTIDFAAIVGVSFIGNAQFTGVAGEVRYYSLIYADNMNYSNSSFIAVDSDGDAEEDVVLELVGHINFTETITGSRILKAATNQTLNGSNAGESLNGGAGNDTLSGLSGNDTLIGGGGNDVLQGGDGNDVLIGGLGVDSLIGGDGADTFRFARPDDFLVGSILFGAAVDSINDFAEDDHIVIAFQGISYVGDMSFSGVPGQYAYGDNTGRQLAFDFDGDKIADSWISLNSLIPSQFALEEKSPGSNRLTIAPNQILLGTTADDDLSGGNGYDVLTGDAGDDKLVAGAAKDTLNGGDGADTLEGGLGADVLTGGAGNDVFKYQAAAEFDTPYSSHDIITDLAVGDKIDLSAIAGLKFVGLGNGFSGVANQVRISSTVLDIDVDGDSYADYSLVLPDNLTIEEMATGSLLFQVAADKALNGGAGNDTVKGGNGNDALKGWGGNDFLTGAYGADTLGGGSGADTLLGGLGTDMLTGGEGNDVFKYKSLAEFGGQYYSSDTITDLTVGDQIDLSAITGLTFAGFGNNFSGVANQISIHGEWGTTLLQIDSNGDKIADYGLALPANLIIEETAAGSRIFQIAENKVLNGTDANDTLAGGNGNDMLDGGAGNDVLFGGYGSDNLLGGDGADKLVGGLGVDTLTGGAGNDIFKYNALLEIDNNGAYWGSNAQNGDTISDLTVGDKINLSAISGLTFAGIGNAFSGVANQVQIIDGSWKRTLLQIDTNGDLNADYSLVLPDNLIIEETAAGSNIFQVAENKTLNGTAANDTLIGGNGNDTLNGGRGNDSLAGAASSDTLNGGDGADTLDGGLGTDMLTGGAGNDVFKYNALAEIDNGAYWESSALNGDTISDFAVGDKINFSAITGLTFAGMGKFFSGVVNQVQIIDDSWNRTLLQIDTNGDWNADYSLILPDNLTIEETAPGSLIFQIAVDKVLNGGSGNDTVKGGNGNDKLKGWAGNDSLTGGYGADTLGGGDGADTLVGGLGIDTLTGGAGNDVFKYNSVAEFGSRYYGDTITDLSVGDKIDLSAIDANSLLAGDQAFSFIGNNGFSVFGGELNYWYGVLSGDVNGDQFADFAITLSGNFVPGASDFIL